MGREIKGKMNEINPQLIAMIQRMPLRLVKDPISRDHTFEVEIATLDPRDNTPRNWIYEGQNDLGGARGVISAGCSGEAFFFWYGPSVAVGEIGQYKNGIRVVREITKRLKAINTIRGPAVDAAEEFGRFLEAVEVDTVYSRPPGLTCSWLNEGPWEVWSREYAISRIRELIANVTQYEFTEDA